MAELNHTIVWSKDRDVSAMFLVEIMGFDPPTRFASFAVVQTTNGVSLDFSRTDGHVAPQHYAFLVSESEFDEIFGRIRERGIDYWAHPSRSGRGEINTRDGGRGVYFADPSGHHLEILTRPYGSGPG
jgi:catechol 2,3-dioxygenase-like lactoylglutathione lyase family enzyme